MRRVHGHVFPSENLTGDLDFITVRTIVDIRPTGLTRDLDASEVERIVFPFVGSDGTVYNDEAAFTEGRAAQRRFDQLVGVVSLRAQPIVIGEVRSAADATPPVADLPGAGIAGDPDATVHTVNFVVEHGYIWSAEDLAVTLDGIEGFIYSLGDTSENNVAVYVSDVSTPEFTYFVS